MMQQIVYESNTRMVGMICFWEHKLWKFSGNILSQLIWDYIIVPV